MNETVYEVGKCITGLIIFIGSYIYCINEYGFLFGLGLGWLPSFIIALIAAYLWPLILFLLLSFILLIF